jgi:hypothetical protein
MLFPIDNRETTTHSFNERVDEAGVTTLWQVLILDRRRRILNLFLRNARKVG